MPVVELPDGSEAEFPDDMPAEQIRAVLAKRFPVQAPPPGDSRGDVERALATPEARAVASGAEAIPFGQKAAALGSAGVLKLWRALSGSPYAQQLDTSYEGNLKRIRGDAAAASAESPLLSGAAKLAGGVASFAALPNGGAAAEGAGIVGRALPGALKMARFGALHALGNDASAGEVAGEAGVSGALGLGLGAALDAAGPYLQRAAGSLKVSSLRPTPTAVEAMERLPGGKAGVGQTLLRENVGALTADAQKAQIAGALDRSAGRIDSAVSRADSLRPPDAPADISTPSASGDPAEVDAVAEELLKGVRGSTDPQAVLSSAGDTAVGRAPRPGGAPEPTQIVPLPAARPSVRPQTLSRRLLSQAQEEVAGPMTVDPEEAVQANGARLSKTLAGLAERDGEGLGASDAVDLYRDMYKRAYQTKDPALFSYRKALQESAGVVRGGVGEHIADVSPELAAEFEGGNLDYRRLLAAQETNDRFAARLAKNHVVGLHDLVIGAGAGFHSPAASVPAVLASKLASRYGPQVAARALWGLGSEAAPEAATAFASPEGERVTALIRLLRGNPAWPQAAAAGEGDR